ncbi:MAG TPA: hypothetical protein VL096_03835, partial [Pirellulaceae bacterium]|nr:hypothetical protein [Pirellulaceae bacterium]
MMINQPILLFALLIPLVTSPSTPAAEWSIGTVAGNGQKGFSGDGGPATAAQLDNPFGVTRGPDGNLWFCEYTGQRVRKITPDGKLQTVAGTG